MSTPQTCSCGTFSIGVCQDCGKLVCRDHSRLEGGQRICDSCIQERRSRDQAAQEAAHDAAHQAVIAEMRAIADPIERLLRIAWYQENFEGLADDWHTVCPEYSPDGWDSVAVGRWFAVRAIDQGIPTRAERIGIKRPLSTMFGNRAKYNVGPEIRSWSFRSRQQHKNWPGVILSDGSVVQLRQGQADYTATSDRDYTIVESITPARLDMNALILMAEALGLTVDRPGLRRIQHPFVYGVIRGPRG